MENEMTLAGILHRKDRLPTLPGIAMRILQAVQKEEPDLEEIAEILSTDPPLSAEVLKIINSSLYSLPTKITSVFHAVKLLGIGTVKNLALSFSLIKSYRTDETTGLNYTLFWKNSLIGAVSARLLSEKIQPQLAEDAFFMGLLHDIGILTLSRCMPKQYSLVIREMEKTGHAYHETETQILGFNHMAVGEYLVKSWGLPETFYMPIGCHHDPEKLDTDHPYVETLSNILHLAALYIDHFNHPDQSLRLGLFERYAQTYDLADKLNIDEIGLQINAQTQHIFPLFEIDLREEKDYSAMLEAARQELIDLSADFVNKLIDQKHEIETLREQVTRDSMTQLHNYQRFHELLRQEIYRASRYKTPLALILTDIDYFKAINDNLGHLAGDYAIKAVANGLKKVLRESDHVARYGGEEFAIILPETTLPNAIRVAERIKETMNSLEIVFENSPIALTMSFGVASLPPDGQLSGEELIQRADCVLYQAKARGRNQCCVFNGNSSRA
ncbi:MAG: GGDEF domain-containing protein [Desulfobacterales bacterium]|nr:MAG: GGDEF domain-containing protein [Desulfobacterales bacterium]